MNLINLLNKWRLLRRLENSYERTRFTAGAWRRLGHGLSEGKVISANEKMCPSRIFWLQCMHAGTYFWKILIRIKLTHQKVHFSYKSMEQILFGTFFSKCTSKYASVHLTHNEKTRKQLYAGRHSNPPMGGGSGHDNTVTSGGSKSIREGSSMVGSTHTLTFYL